MSRRTGRRGAGKILRECEGIRRRPVGSTGGVGGGASGLVYGGVVPLAVEILAHAPGVFLQCRRCEVALDEVGVGGAVRADQARTALPPEMLEEYARVSGWVAGLAAAYGDRVAVEVIDVASPRGLWKSLRYRVSRYPAIVVDGEVVGDVASADAAISRRLVPPASS